MQFEDSDSPSFLSYDTELELCASSGSDEEHSSYSVSDEELETDRREAAIEGNQAAEEFISAMQGVTNRLHARWEIQGTDMLLFDGEHEDKEEEEEPRAILGMNSPWPLAGDGLVLWLSASLAKLDKTKKPEPQPPRTMRSWEERRKQREDNRNKSQPVFLFGAAVTGSSHVCELFTEVSGVHVIIRCERVPSSDSEYQVTAHCECDRHAMWCVHAHSALFKCLGRSKSMIATDELHETVASMDQQHRAELVLSLCASGELRKSEWSDNLAGVEVHETKPPEAWLRRSEEQRYFGIWPECDEDMRDDAMEEHLAEQRKNPLNSLWDPYGMVDTNEVAELERSRPRLFVVSEGDGVFTAVVRRGAKEEVVRLHMDQAEMPPVHQEEQPDHQEPQRVADSMGLRHLQDAFTLKHVRSVACTCGGKGMQKQHGRHEFTWTYCLHVFDLMEHLVQHCLTIDRAAFDQEALLEFVSDPARLVRALVKSCRDRLAFKRMQPVLNREPDKLPTVLMRHPPRPLVSSTHNVVTRRITELSDVCMSWFRNPALAVAVALVWCPTLHFRSRGWSKVLTEIGYSVTARKIMDHRHQHFLSSLTLQQCAMFQCVMQPRPDQREQINRLATKNILQHPTYQGNVSAVFDALFSLPVPDHQHGVAWISAVLSDCEHRLSGADTGSEDNFEEEEEEEKSDTEKTEEAIRMAVILMKCLKAAAASPSDRSDMADEVAKDQSMTVMQVLLLSRRMMPSGEDATQQLQQRARAMGELDAAALATALRQEPRATVGALLLEVVLQFMRVHNNDPVVCAVAGAVIRQQEGSRSMQQLLFSSNDAHVKSLLSAMTVDPVSSTRLRVTWAWGVAYGRLHDSYLSAWRNPEQDTALPGAYCQSKETDSMVLDTLRDMLAKWRGNVKDVRGAVCAVWDGCLDVQKDAEWRLTRGQSARARIAAYLRVAAGLKKVAFDNNTLQSAFTKEAQQIVATLSGAKQQDREPFHTNAVEVCLEYKLQPTLRSFLATVQSDGPLEQLSAILTLLEKHADGLAKITQDKVAQWLSGVLGEREDKLWDVKALCAVVRLTRRIPRPAVKKHLLQLIPVVKERHAQGYRQWNRQREREESEEERFLSDTLASLLQPGE